MLNNTAVYAFTAFRTARTCYDSSCTVVLNVCTTSASNSTTITINYHVCMFAAHFS